MMTGYIMVKECLTLDSSNFSANDSADWYIGSTGDSSYVPMNFNERLSLQAKLALNVGGGKGIVLNGLYQDDKYRDYNHLYQLNPDGDYNRYQKSILGIASYTLLLSNSAFIDFSFRVYRSEYNSMFMKIHLKCIHITILRRTYTQI